MHAASGQQQFPGQGSYQSGNFPNSQMNFGQIPPGMSQQAFGAPNQQPPNPQSAFMPINPAQNTSMQIHPPGLAITSGMNAQGTQQNPIVQQQQPQQSLMIPPGSQVPPHQLPPNAVLSNPNNFHQPQPQNPIQMNQMPTQIQHQPQPMIQQVAPPAPVQQPIPVASKEPETAELISFD